MAVNEPEAVHQFVSSAKYLAALRRISRSSRSLAFSRSSTRMRSASDSPEAAVAESDAAMRLATFSPLALVLVRVPKASRQLRSELRLTPEPLGVGLAWHGGKVPHFPSDMLVSACPPPGGQVLSRKVRVLTVNTVGLPVRAIRCVVAVGCLGGNQIY